MSYIVIPSRRLWQPQTEVRVRWGHWSTDGLALAINWADGTGRNLANPATVAALGANATRSAGMAGQARNAATADNKLASFGTTVHVSSSSGTGIGGFTYMSLAAPIPSSSGQEALISQVGSSGTVQSYLLTNSGSDYGGYSGRIAFGVYNAGTFLAQTASGVFDGRPHVFVGSRNGTTYSIDLDGVEVGSSGLGAADMYFDAFDIVTIGGINGYTTYTRTTPHYATLAWNRGLSAAERQEIGRYPWIWLEPDVRRLYFGASGGAGTTDAAIAGTQATDVGVITAEATTGAALAGTQATDVGAVAVAATTGCAVAGTQATDGAAVDVTAGTGSGTTADIGGVQASDVGAIAVSATLGLAIAGTQASDLGYIVVAATVAASMAGTQASDVAAIVVAGSSIWTDVGVSAATWSDVGGASSIWTDL
jgi:hypothetical protein